MVTRKKDDAVALEANESPQTREDDDGRIVDTVTGEVLLDAPSDVVVRASERVTRRFTPDQLAQLETWDDLDVLAEALGEEFEEAGKVLGDGFVLLRDKRVLVGVPLRIIDWRESDGKFTDSYVAVMAMTKHPVNVAGRETQRVVFNDGGTGICGELKEYYRRKTVTKPANQTALISCPDGLRLATYERFDKDTGEIIIDEATGRPAIGETYWL